MSKYDKEIVIDAVSSDGRSALVKVTVTPDVVTQTGDFPGIAVEVTLLRSFLSGGQSAVVSAGKAVCHPLDKFDFAFGFKLASDRMFEGLVSSIMWSSRFRAAYWKGIHSVYLAEGIDIFQKRKEK